MKKVLVIGLGGMGSDIVNMVAKEIEDNRNIAFITMDTNLEDINNLMEDIDGKVVNIGIGMNKAVVSYLKTLPSWYEWFPNEPLLLPISLGKETKQLRSLTRLPLESSENVDIIRDIREIIHYLVEDNNDNIINIKVLIVSSLVGGTGASLVLQIPEIIKSELAHFPNVSYIIRGLFVMPDVFRDYMCDKISKENTYVNAYSTLKEINALNTVCTTPNNIPLSFEMNFGNIQSKDIQSKFLHLPYNLIFTLDRAKANMNNIKILEETEEEIKDIIRIQIFAPFLHNLFSIEDNRFYDLSKNNGRNIYGSAGISRLIYPYRDIVDYVTTRKVQDLITNQWHYFDIRYEQVLQEFHRQRLHVFDLKKPELRDTIIYETEKLLEDKSDSKLDFMKRDLLIENDKEQFKINKVVDYYVRTRQYVYNLIAKNEEINELLELCTINNIIERNLRNPNKVKDTINYIEDKLKELKATIDELTKKFLPIKALKEIIPENLNIFFDDSVLMGIKPIEKISEYNILDILRKGDKYIHPLSARYVFSKLINLIEEDKKYNEEELIKVIRKIEEYGFAFDDPDTEGIIETPEMIINRHLHRILPQYRRGYKEIVSLFESNSIQQRELLKEYGKLKIYNEVFNKVLRRLRKIEEAYNTLFLSLYRIEGELEYQIDYLEKKNYNTASKIYLNSTPEEKQHIYKKISKVYNFSEELNNLINKNINENVLTKGIEVIKVEEFGTNLKNRFLKSDEFIPIFKENVIDNSKKDIIKNTRDLLDKDIATILFEKATDKRTQKVNINIIDTYLDQLLKYSTPLLDHNIKVQEENKISNNFDTKFSHSLNYWGFNPKVATKLSQLINSNFSKNFITLGNFLKSKSNLYDAEIVTSESFSPYELICYNSVYGIKPENIPNIRKYKETYKERVKSLIRNGIPLGVNLDTLSTITPHLDFHWHNTLPDLFSED